MLLFRVYYITVHNRFSLEYKSSCRIQTHFCTQNLNPNFYANGNAESHQKQKIARMTEAVERATRSVLFARDRRAKFHPLRCAKFGERKMSSGKIEDKKKKKYNPQHAVMRSDSANHSVIRSYSLATFLRPSISR